MGPYRTPVPTTPPQQPRADGGAALVALAGVLLVVLAIRAARYEPHPLAELPPEERAQLLQRTLDNLELCAHHREPELHNFCESQAVIARALPECGPDCRARTHSRYPSRVPSALP